MAGDDLPPLDTLRQTIQEKKQRIGEPPPDEAMSSKALAMRMGSDIIAGVVVGALLGYFLDEQLGTKPLFLSVLLLLGIAGGFLNMYRTYLRASAAEDATENHTEKNHQ